jgi:PAS domain S-box-containing protein
MPNASLPQFPKNLPEQIIENSPSGMMLVDAQQPDMPIVYVNKAFEHLTGYTADEALGKNARFLQADDRQQPAIEQMRHALEAHENVVTTLRNYRKDGTLFWNEVRISYLRDPQGTVTHAVGILNDITAHIEDAERYRQSFESNSAVHLLVEADDGHIVDANSAAARFYGYTVAQLKSMHIYEINKLGKEEFLRLSKLIVSERKSDFVTQHRLASGAVRDVQVYASSIRTPQGWLNHAIIVDVTDRLTVEQRYQSLFKQSNDAVFILDLDGHHLQVNQRACDLLGYSVEELLLLSNRDIVVPHELHESLGVLERLKSGEQVPPYSRVFRHKDGTLINTELNVELVRDSKGNPLHVLSIVRDISERKQVEDALRESEESYRQTIATMHEGLVLQKADGRIQLCNPAAERILGLTADQMMGRTSTDPRWRAIHEDYSPFPGETHPAMFTLRTGEPQFNVVMGVYKPDDTLTWILINAQPLFNKVQEKPYAVVATFADISERKRMEDALRESEGKYRLIAENTLAQKYDELDQFFNVSAGMLTITNTDGILLKVNTAWEKLLGLPVAQIEGRRFLDFVHPDDVQATLGAMTQLSHQKPVIEFVNRYRAADGSYRYIEWRANPHGNLIYASGRDITGRRQMEESLRESEEKYRLIAENTSDGIMIIEGDTRITSYASPAYDRQHGRGVGESLGMGAETRWSYIHPDDREAVIRQIKDTIIHRQTHLTLTYRARHKDGHYFWREDISRYLYSPDGTYQRSYIISRDITGRKRMEEALKESEEKYRLIAENTSDGILVLDSLLGAITYASPSYDLQHGRAIGETQRIEPDALLETIHPEDRERVLKQIFDAVDRKEPNLVYSYRSQHKDGHYLWCEDHSRFNYAPDGRYLSSIIISRNVTERKQAEEKQLALTLEKERTGMLTQFIQDAAHEFRTPLSIISSGTHLLLRSEQQELRQHKANQINDQIKRITRLVEMLLLLVKAERDDVLRQQKVDIISVLQVGCELYDFEKEDNLKKPELRFSPPPELPAVMGDSNLLLEAFSQLLGNAYHFTPPEGTITVTMGTADGQVWVEVDDTGKGIAEENLSHIFDTFWRLDDAHTTAGFGLGLPIAKRIIEHHGGTITVRSQLRQGTQMRVTLPAAP